MGTILVGIDEAGYGPTLGPLCVAISVFRVADPSPDKPADKAPDLWKLLAQGVCKAPGRSGKTDSKGRIAVADSKALKLPNSVVTTHPLIHLERGVLSFLRHRASNSITPATDLDLFDALFAGGSNTRATSLADELNPANLKTFARPSVRGAHACYLGKPIPLPTAVYSNELGINANTVARALSTGGVELLDLACVLVWENDFNRRIREGMNKADVSGGAVAVLMNKALDLAALFATKGDRVGIVCDRQGGRMVYGPWLERALPGATIEMLSEDESRSRYVLHQTRNASPLRAGVAFMVEAEQHHLPVALASMTAKYCRELAMARFNAHWSAVALAQGFALASTAGYATDARRWLTDMQSTLSFEDRNSLVRIA